MSQKVVYVKYGLIEVFQLVYTRILASLSSLRQTFEGAGPEQPFRSNIAIFDIREKLRLDPSGLRFSNLLRQFGFRADHCVELLSDLA